MAQDELLEKLLELEGHPAISLKKDNNIESAVLRDTTDGRRILIDYEDTRFTEEYRDKLNTINSCFLRHWFDLEIKDAEIPISEERIINHETKEPINFSRRTLVRIFSNGSFKEGGRF